VPKVRRGVAAIAALLGAGCGRPGPDATGGRVPLRPDPPPAAVAGLVGQYGRAGRGATVCERNGEPYLLLPGAPPARLARAGPERGAAGFRAGDLPVAVLRDGAGRAAALVVAADTWPRRPETDFRVAPRRPVAVLRREALAATPPAPPPGGAAPDLVELASLDSTIHYDIRYATARNFMGTPFYAAARAYLQRPAAEALVRAHRRLAVAGYGLLIHDAYRPWYVTKMFWDATPDAQKAFVADPAQGSRHNRGAAVDVSLYARATGRPVAMPSGYDEFTERAYPAYPGGTTLERWHRDLLRVTLEAEGFRVYPYEWWHFDYHDWERYPVLNLTFEQIAAADTLLRPGGGR
jgi:D-alanyl-D-alanine dipeptidase